MAQLVAHLLCKQGVRGSSPLGSTLGSTQTTRGPHPGGGWGPLAFVPQSVGASVPGFSGFSGFAAADRRGALFGVVPVVPGVVGAVAVREALLRRGVAGFEAGAAVVSTAAFAAVSGARLATFVELSL